MLLIAGFLLCSQVIHSQIVNIEKKRLNGDDNGWYGDVYVNFAVRKTTKNLLNLGTGGHVTWLDSTQSVLLIADLRLVRAEGEKFSNDGFLHLRYTNKLSKLIFFEGFSQSQYNTLTKIDNRWLTGAGVRFQLTDYDNALFYWGVMMMYEREKLNSPEVTHHDVRMSSYFSFALRPQETVSFISTTYIQPKINNWNDYRLLNENSMNLSITNKLKFSVWFNLSYDTNPPIEVPNLTYSLKNGITYDF